MSDFHLFHTFSSFLRQDVISGLLLGGRSQAKHLKSNLVLGSIWGETQTKAACTIGKSCHGHAQEEAVGKKANLVCSLHLGAWVGYHDPPHFNLILAPCWQPPQSEQDSLWQSSWVQWSTGCRTDLPGSVHQPWAKAGGWGSREKRASCLLVHPQKAPVICP